MTLLEFKTSYKETTEEAQKDAPLILLDNRTDVLGSRVAFDVEKFAHVRKTLGVPAEMSFRVLLRSVDVTVEADVLLGAFAPVNGSKYNTWKIVVPVKDYYSFDSEALEIINRTFYMLVRHAVHTRTLIYMFRNTKMAFSASEGIQPLLLADAQINSKKLLDDQHRVLVASSQGSFLEAAEFEELDES